MAALQERDHTSAVDVLVVGAGPAGLTCALGLKRAGVNVRIIDQSSHRVAAGHADGVMPRTTEILQSYGVGDALLTHANHVYCISNYNYDPATGGIKCAGRVPMINEPSARYKFAATHNQGFIEGILGDALLASGLAVERPCRPTSMEISPDENDLRDSGAYPIKVAIRRLDDAGSASDEIIRAKFVVGADGAHSWVRRTLGIPMEGESTAHAWAAIDFVPSAESNFPDWRNVATVNAKDVGIMLIPREDGKIRLYIELGSEEGLVDAATGRLDVSQFNVDRLLEIAKKAFAPWTLSTTHDDIDWWTVYVVGQRVASHFSVHERVFIAGDACHTHSPKGGQGMNVSISDSHNLAWKLAYAIKGYSSLDLLKTYEFERRIFAQELIAFDKWFSEGFSAKARAKLMEGTGDVVLPGPLEAFRTFSALTTGIGIEYAASAITAAPSESRPSTLAVGKRVPPQLVVRVADNNPIEIQDLIPADGRIKLFVFPGNLGSKSDLELLQMIADKIQETLSNYPNEIFDIITVAKQIGVELSYVDVPLSLRKSWKSILMEGPQSDFVGVYDAYGIAEGGAIIVVRPDGYVGTNVPLRSIEELAAYLAMFLRPSV